MSVIISLHDATLNKIELEWNIGQLTANLTVSEDSRKVLIVGCGISSLYCSRCFPWGRSVSVNKCAVEPQDGFELLKIEMQSGDNIFAQGKKFIIEGRAG
ncbi:hypothetical protein [Rhodoblastus acidophilus]|uniref:hypothetical protein n=1 Tax=Rhodoblastus acidophilus TaxID=1074 RepID=UPI0011301601|nr:hypothetical protein [Rhodoblastus acidophilus]